MKKIGFIGLGIMGETMANRLLKNGYELIVYNRTKEKILNLTPNNFVPVSSPAEVAENCNIIVSMLADSRALKNIVYGENGLLSNLKSDLIHVDMSTVSVDTTKEIYNDYRERNAHFIHAPVLGGKTQAKDGTLLIFAGGDKVAIEKCEEIFKILGKKIWKFDSVERATALKLAMNSMIATMIVALSQAFVLAEKAGISKETLLEVLENSALNSTMYQNKGKTIINGNFEPNFYVKHMLKDINLILDLGLELKIPLPVLSSIREIYIKTVSKYELEDYSAVYKIIAELADLKI